MCTGEAQKTLETLRSGCRLIFMMLSASRRGEAHPNFLSLVTSHIMRSENSGLPIFSVFDCNPATEIEPASAVPTVHTMMRSDRPGQKSIRVANFAFTWYKGKNKYTTYSPFAAMPGEGWQTATRETAGADVREDVNKTMLGLYSFQAVSCPLCWYLDPEETSRRGHHKTAAPKKRRVCVAAVKETIDLCSGI
ncbi:hypothetical protein FB451DRAFT_1187916 [Mycena latifolia]|nr:hypothetical protein FB451DRAFT_1187916 [Mycena latifolia]